MKKTFLQKEEGAAAVEFAIVLPLLLLVLFGIIEFSAILYDKAMITNASREGARAGIVYRWPTKLTTGEIQAIAANYLQENLINFGGESSATISVTGAQGAAGTPLNVTITYDYDFLVLPKFADTLAEGIHLSAQTIMRME